MMSHNTYYTLSGFFKDFLDNYRYIGYTTVMRTIMNIENMTRLEKLQWIHKYLDNLLNGTTICATDTKTAIGFIEDILDCYTQDFK